MLCKYCGEVTQASSELRGTCGLSGIKLESEESQDLGGASFKTIIMVLSRVAARSRLIVQRSANRADSFESLYLVQYTGVKALLRYGPL